jgi:peroxiredoxin
MIEVGRLAPDFTLIDHNKREVALSSYRGRKSVILSFHVYTFTDG